MAIRLNSFSSSLMFGITMYRNQQGVANKVVAQAGYALTAVIAAVETVATAALSVLSLCAYLLSPASFEYSSKWLSSSIFSLGWSITDFLLNPFVAPLVADEASARKILESRNLMMLPSGAIT